MLRLYLAPQIGSGTRQNPFRSLLNNLIDTAAGDRFSEMDNPARHISLCCLDASSATHTAVSANSQVVSLGESAGDRASFTASLNGLLSGLPNLAALQSALEARGVSITWISSANTVRDLVRWLLRGFAIAQLGDGEGVPAVKAVAAASLSAQFNIFSSAERDAVRNWMAAKGLATGWIKPTTTVRQILHFIVENMGFGVFRMEGEAF
jgi:hypothetical protein